MNSPTGNLRRAFPRRTSNSACLATWRSAFPQRARAVAQARRGIPAVSAGRRGAPPHTDHVRDGLLEQGCS
jgi:hypothetical protein